MRYFADLHMHSRFARATSKDLTLPVLNDWAAKKGIAVLGTGDFTHPTWFSELKDGLTEAPEEGLFILKNADTTKATRFLLTVEISSIYSKGNKTRRIHTLVMLPSFEAAEDFNADLSLVGNLRSDGRPILGMDARNVAKAAFKAHHEAIVVPAHAWTPWFSVFGSMSGFDSLEECFDDMTDRILAIETGLSSDPPMNWRLSVLDEVALISSSDAHSPAKIGREATEFEGEMSFFGIREALYTGAPARASERDKSKTKLLGTVEFYPEEGKYHYDGHRNCQICWTPEERASHGGVCSVCGRPVTVGVLSRVGELADRKLGFKPDGAPDYRSLVPLEEIIAEALDQKTGTKAVEEQYNKLLAALGNEFAILIDADIGKIAEASSPLIAEGVKRVREGKLDIKPGYDGEFGTVSIFSGDERKQITRDSSPQQSLF